MLERHAMLTRLLCGLCLFVISSALHTQSYGQSQKDPAGLTQDSQSGKPAETEGEVPGDTNGQKKKYEILITATKTGINKKETGASITVITAAEIEQSKKTKVVDLLKSSPGISVSQSCRWALLTSTCAAPHQIT